MRRIARIGVLALVMLASTAQVASAFTLMSSGYYRKSLGVNTSGTSSTYATAISRAASSWNNAYVGVSVTANTAPYANTMETRWSSDSYYGFYQPQRMNAAYFPHETTQFKIVINTRACANLGTNGKQSVVCHELGHAWGLSEEPVNNAVMKGTRYREVVYTPQPDDRNGVVAIWR